MINYKKIELESSKPWIMLVHGFTQNMEVFNKQVEFFSSSYNLILIDIRGHGGSAGMGGPYGIEEYADDVEEVIYKEQLTDLIYWGTHTGTAIALALYFRIGARFRAFILEGVVIPGYKMARTAELLGIFRNAAREQGVEAAKESWLSNDWFTAINAAPERSRRDEHAAIVANFKCEALLSDEEPKEIVDVSGRLGEVEIPALIINGSGDLLEFLEAASNFRVAPKARGVIIDDCGAFPNWESPDEVNRVVNDFLKTV